MLTPYIAGKMSGFLWLMVLLCLYACGSKDDVVVSESHKKKEISDLPALKKSFVLRQGKISDITCMAVDGKGHVYAAGVSDSKCVIFKLDSALKGLEKMAKFGSAGGGDIIKDMAIDSESNIFITGYTRQSDFPVTQGCYDENFASGRQSLALDEGFVVKFSPTLELLAATFIGGDGREKAHAIAIGQDDNVYVAGFSEGVDQRYCQAFMPPPKAYDNKPAPNHHGKAFIAKLSNDLARLEASTLLGGNQAQHDSNDEAYGLAIDRLGNVWVTGQANSKDFPVTPGCVEPTYAGKGDVFVSKLNADLSRLLASTYLGGINQELATAMVLDKDDNVFVGGWTESNDFPMVPDCYDVKHSHEEEDGFVVKLSPDLRQLIAATFLGGEYDASGYGDDLVASMDLSANGQMLCVTGQTDSENFPVTDRCYKCYSDDNATPPGDKHRNERRPREGRPQLRNYGDGFITLFDADLKDCVYSTYLGGDSQESVDDILFDGNDLLVAGITYSSNFPRVTAKQKQPGSRGFAIRYNWETGM